MKSDRKKELGLMVSMLKIGCVGFGGGSALIPVIEKEVVEEQGLVQKEEYDKDVIVEKDVWKGEPGSFEKAPHQGGRKTAGKDIRGDANG